MYRKSTNLVPIKEKEREDLCFPFSYNFVLHRAKVIEN